MSRTFYITAAAAMFASVAAFAQTSTSTPAATPDTSASAPAASDSSTPDTDKKMHHHHHHMMKSARAGDTDNDADKLNACMSNATPTQQQESCLKKAES